MARRGREDADTAPARPPAFSARRRLGSFRRSFICKAPGASPLHEGENAAVLRREVNRQRPRPAAEAAPGSSTEFSEAEE